LYRYTYIASPLQKALRHVGREHTTRSPPSWHQRHVSSAPCKPAARTYMQKITQRDKGGKGCEQGRKSSDQAEFFSTPLAEVRAIVMIRSIRPSKMSPLVYFQSYLSRIMPTETSRANPRVSHSHLFHKASAELCGAVISAPSVLVCVAWYP
jgi:hypothetical protein